LQLQYEVVDNTLIVKFDGELDHHVAKDIRTEIDETIDRQRVKNLIFDLNNMSFMDSSGIGVIIGRYKHINKLGGKVSVIHTTAKIGLIIVFIMPKIAAATIVVLKLDTLTPIDR
jgi:stage II sporulation protein AA (anti-sigma F factor antagonist)